jgi:hypothetical protein
MKTATARRAPRRAAPCVEELESRQVPSVSVLPNRIDLGTVSSGQGVFTVQIQNDANPATANLLDAGADFLGVDVLDAAGNDTPLPAPLSVQSAGSDLLLQFSRSALSGLAAGTYQVQVSDGTLDDGTPADAETGSLTLVDASQGPTHHGPAHHHHHRPRPHRHQPPARSATAHPAANARSGSRRPEV